MNDRTHDDPPAPDRTRDITLPPLPDRAPPALPKAWAGLPAPSRKAQVEKVDPAVEEARRLARSRTDELLPPPKPVVRERTLAFSSPEMRHRSIEPVRVQPNPRRWPWVVLTLLPILVIVGFGVAWLLLVGGL
jgi:hypothetical protein